MKAAVWTSAVLSLLLIKATGAVPPSYHRRARKQSAPSRAPLSGNQGILTPLDTSQPIPTSATRLRVAKPPFKPSPRPMIIALTATNSPHRKPIYFAKGGTIPRSAKGKEVDLSPGNRIDKEKTQASESSPSSSSSDNKAASDESEATSSIAPKKGSRFQHETKVERLARQKMQADLIHTKWEELKLSPTKIAPDKMADIIRGIKIGDMPRRTISRTASQRLLITAGPEYQGKVIQALAKKANIDSLARFREKTNPAAQRRKYVRKAKKT